MGEFTDALGTAVLGYERQYFAEKRKDQDFDKGVKLAKKKAIAQDQINLELFQTRESRKGKLAEDLGLIPIGQKVTEYGLETDFGTQKHKQEKDQAEWMKRENAAMLFRKNQEDLKKSTELYREAIKGKKNIEGAGKRLITSGMNNQEIKDYLRDPKNKFTPEEQGEMFEFYLENKSLYPPKKKTGYSSTSFE